LCITLYFFGDSIENTQGGMKMPFTSRALAFIAIRSPNMSSTAEEKSASLVFAQSLRSHAYLSRGRGRGRRERQQQQAGIYEPGAGT
jgi:hypothetical protein